MFNIFLTKNPKNLFTKQCTPKSIWRNYQMHTKMTSHVLWFHFNSNLFLKISNIMSNSFLHQIQNPKSKVLIISARTSIAHIHNNIPSKKLDWMKALTANILYSMFIWWIIVIIVKECHILHQIVVLFLMISMNFMNCWMVENVLGFQQKIDLIHHIVTPMWKGKGWAVFAWLTHLIIYLTYYSISFDEKKLFLF